MSTFLQNVISNLHTFNAKQKFNNILFSLRYIKKQNVLINQNRPIFTGLKRVT